MANQIQTSVLPHEFPPFPERKEFELYAMMEPAREVGGDFYDFFLIDDDHLCLVIADVSGKGIPASLFMMNSKVLIKSFASGNNSPAEVLEKVNKEICENNQMEMFVTVWLGVLELSTGKIVASNAGHEYPVIGHAGGEFELIKDRHGFVVGGMDDVKYKDYELQLEPGDKLFVYTDGVPEATNVKNELFGTDRMLDALNADSYAPVEELLRNVRKAVSEFTAGAEQFDDLTMLAVEYTGNVLE
jgi:sigma-B regulation protein RsbU (phosphoserine phosphatase)